MYGLSGLLLVIVGLWIKTDNTAYQALVLVWLWCGNLKQKLGPNKKMYTDRADLAPHSKKIHDHS